MRRANDRDCGQETASPSWSRLSPQVPNQFLETLFKLLVVAKIYPVSDAKGCGKCYVFSKKRNYASPRSRDVRPDSDGPFERGPFRLQHCTRNDYSDKPRRIYEPFTIGDHLS